MGISFAWRLRNIPEAKGKIEKDFQRLVKLVGLIDNDEISVTICGDKLIRSLNRKYRGKDEVTDVLSFPIDECTVSFQPNTEAGFKVERESRALVLGDIVVNYSQVKRQAKQNHNSVEDELMAVITHSFLHLLGFSHSAPRASKLMEQIEGKLFKYFRLEVKDFGH